MKTRRNSSKLFIDSGAFTSWTKGISVDVDSYIDYINNLDDKITICAQVDCIPGTFLFPITYILSDIFFQKYMVINGQGVLHGWQ